MPTKVRLVKAMVFLVVMYGRASWTIKKNAAAKSLQSCLTLCDPIGCSLPGSSILGILQARTLEWVAISFSNAWKWKVKVKVKSCPTLCNPMDCSLRGSSVHGIFQARVLEWVAIAFSERKLKAEELLLLNCGVGEDSWESLGLQEDPTSPS